MRKRSKSRKYKENPPNTLYGCIFFKIFLSICENFLAYTTDRDSFKKSVITA